MDSWGFEQLEPWLRARERMPVGPLFCVLNGPSCGRAWHASAARAALHRRAARAGVRRRFAPHQLWHAHALELLREGVPLNVVQRQLGHRNLGVTSNYLQGIDLEEIIETVHPRRPPMIPAGVELAPPRATDPPGPAGTSRTPLLLVQKAIPSTLVEQDVACGRNAQTYAASVCLVQASANIFAL